MRCGTALRSLLEYSAGVWWQIYNENDDLSRHFPPARAVPWTVYYKLYARRGKRFNLATSLASSKLTRKLVQSEPYHSGTTVRTGAGRLTLL